MGYANRLKRLDFPDLSEPDDPIFVVIRNPKTLSGAQLVVDQVDLDADGRPTDLEQAKRASYGLLASLIRDWHVYDATVDEDPPLLGLPAQPDDIDRLPAEIAMAIAAEVNQITNPR